MYKLKFLKALNSPFKPFKLRWYFGKTSIGTPYFLPRKWVKDKNNPGNSKSVPKKIGFDFVGLGWKTKWTSTDYRFEWSPILSFVFFKYQIVLSVVAPHPDEYWEAWLYYDRNTDKNKTKEERIKQCYQEYPMIHQVYHSDGRKEIVDYYGLVLKKKYYDLILKDIVG